jgi:hypothetical protein
MRPRGVAFSFAALVICLLAVWGLAAYWGFLDSSKFEIVQSVAVAPNRIVMLGRRSDHNALSGNTYFAFIGDHLYKRLN